MAAEAPGDPAPALAHADAPQPVLQALADALARQRAVLEQGTYAHLAGLTAEIERHFVALAAWPGGPAALRAAITALPEAERQVLRGLLGQVDADNRVSGDLIRVAMQRMAAIQAFTTAGSDSGTYGARSGPDAGSRLSRRA